MPKFNKGNINELKEFLYNSYSHDAKLKIAKYDCGQDSLKIELYNPIFNVKMYFYFHNIEIVFTVKGEWFGNRETINSITVEEDFSYLHNYLLKRKDYMEESLYLLFQMFSGDELHIVSKEVVIEIIR